MRGRKNVSNVGERVLQEICAVQMKMGKTGLVKSVAKEHIASTVGRL